MDGRPPRNAGYVVGQRIRKRIEEVFSRIRKPGGPTKTKVHGRPKVEAIFTFAYNLIRLPKLLSQAPA